jgi:HAL2 family 3'(2'),5'-bisphosphate nucleotidase
MSDLKLELDQEKDVAIDLAKNALKIMEWFKTHSNASFKKEDKSPVTIADFASQIYIISKIKEYFPEDRIIAEEESSFLDENAKILISECFDAINIIINEELEEILSYKGGKSKRSWAIDPIDGTIGYQKNLYYAVGIGLLSKSVPILSVISVPEYQNTGLSIFSAVKGQGAKVSHGSGQFKQIQVSKTENLEDTTLCHSLHHDKPWVLKFASKTNIKNRIRIDSMAKTCMIADGSADIYLKPMDKSRSFTWDFCQGDLLVKEAGGVVTDTNNKNLKYKDKNCLFTGIGMVAANLSLHEKTIKMIKKLIKS